METLKPYTWLAVSIQVFLFAKLSSAYKQVDGKPCGVTLAV